jgi:enoyl-CoA hydratase/carnithine racemase
MLADLERFLDDVEQSGARALVVHSTSPKGFCAGANLLELLEAIDGRDYDDYRGEAAEFIDRIHAVMDRLDVLPMTTVAAIHGVCFGGGFELALTCDLWVADRTARFCFPELRLGIIPGFGGIPRLKRELSNGIVRDLLLTGRSINAKRAAALGLVSQMVAAGEALGTARQVARQAALFNPDAAQVAKRFIKQVPHEELAQEKAHFLRLLGQPAAIKALRDFAQRSDAMPYQPQAGEGL